MPVSDRFLLGTHRILDLLDRHGVQATFFVLGNVARHSPELIRGLHHAGHEIQTHGFDHTPIHRQRPHEFRADVLRAKATLEDLTGQAVVGYRAPTFSITRRTIWAIDVLASCGFAYDSSIFPLRIRGYGIAEWYAGPHWVTTRNGARLIELPVATHKLCGWRIPLGGGGYFRLLPYPLIRGGLRRIEADHRPAVVYCHPHEFDPEGLSVVGGNLDLLRALHQGLGRRSFSHKIGRMLTDFRFGPVRAVLSESLGLPHHNRWSARGLGITPGQRPTPNIFVHSNLRSMASV